jgi:PTS system ascorbate-specific IIA component
MSVGLLVITHNGIGKDILATAGDIFGSIPMQVRVISITPQGSYEASLTKAEKEVQELDSGDGVLILTDIFGATPSNIALKAAKGRNACVIAGINLPMVVRVLNYSQLPLSKIVAKATSAGHDSIIECGRP